MNVTVAFPVALALVYFAVDLTNVSQTRKTRDVWNVRKISRGFLRRRERR